MKPAEGSRAGVVKPAEGAPSIRGVVGAGRQRVGDPVEFTFRGDFADSRVQASVRERTQRQENKESFNEVVVGFAACDHAKGLVRIPAATRGSVDGRSGVPHGTQPSRAVH